MLFTFCVVIVSLLPTHRAATVELLRPNHITASWTHQPITSVPPALGGLTTLTLLDHTV